MPKFFRLGVPRSARQVNMENREYGTAPLGSVPASRHATPIMRGGINAAKTNKALMGCVHKARHSFTWRRSSQSKVEEVRVGWERCSRLTEGGTVDEVRNSRGRS